MECYCCDCQPQVCSRNISTSIVIRILQNPIVRLVYFGKMSNKDLQEKLEELTEKNKPTEKEIKEQEELPTTLSGLRSWFGLTKFDERELLVSIYNCEITAKVNYRQDMQSKPPEINPKISINGRTKTSGLGNISVEVRAGPKKVRPTTQK